MASGWPLFLVHSGNPPYLAFTLAQARFASPDNTIHLIGDDSNKNYKGVNHILAKELAGSYSAFDALYEHLSMGNEVFERRCFHRWFMLNAAVQSSGLERVWCIDSDVLLYDALDYDYDLTENADIAVSFAGVPAAVHFSSDGLQRFCDFIIELYTNQKPYLRDCFEHYKAKNPSIHWGGITDMHAFWMFVQRDDVMAVDLSVPQSGSVFDQDIHQPQGFEFDELTGKKRIYWQKRIPFFRHLETKLVVRCKALHMASGSKNEVHRYYTGPGLYKEKALLEARLRWSKIKRKVNNLLGR